MADRFWESYRDNERWTSYGRTLTEADIVSFAALSGDYSPRHLDEEFSQRHTPSGCRTAHPALLFSITMGIAWQVKMKNRNITYGVDNVAFEMPVKPGDTLSVTGTVVHTAAYPKLPQYGAIVMRYETKNQRGERVLVCDHRMLVERESPGHPAKPEATAQKKSGDSTCPNSQQEVETHGRTITTADIVHFSGISGDFHVAHLNEEHMAKSSYGRPIAHGDLVLSVSCGLLWQIRKSHWDWEIGLDRVRFPTPTFAGDTLAVRASLIDRTEHPNGERQRWNIVTRKQTGETVCAFWRDVIFQRGLSRGEEAEIRET